MKKMGEILFMFVSMEKGESFRSRIIKIAARIINVKATWEKTGEELWKEIEKKQLKDSFEPPQKLFEKYNIEKKQMNGYIYYTMKPINNQGNKRILYLHGGGYVLKISSLHWEFLAKLIDELNCTITVPMYPLAPKFQHEDVFTMILPIYQEIILNSKEEDVVIMGDSAGGGMSLALSQLLHEKDERQPGNIILISPALDMTLTNPEIKEYEIKDPVLATAGVREIAKLYAGDKSVGHYLISPLYGNIEGLGKISLFIGTNDLLYPDAKRFKNIIEEKAVPMNYYEYKSMIHVWPLFPLPEAKKAIKQMIEIIMTK